MPWGTMGILILEFEKLKKVGDRHEDTTLSRLQREVHETLRITQTSPTEGNPPYD